MTAFIAWGEAALIASAALMVIVLAIRNLVRQQIGPQLGYALWAIPAVRLILPTLPANLLEGFPLAGRAAAKLPVLFIGPRETLGSWRGLEQSFISEAIMVTWLIGAAGLFAVFAIRHIVFCRRLLAEGSNFGSIGPIRIIGADVAGPLAFGVFRRVIAVPRTFAVDYNVAERDLVLAHECAHHARGDLIANWASIIVLAMHWWNPVAWFAIRAFRDDQEYAADAQVLAERGAGALPSYAHVLAKAAGIGALPACNLNARSNLKGRLIMLGRNQWTSRRLSIGGVVLVFLGSTALAATATKSGVSGAATGRQAVTIGVKPNGKGGYALIVGNIVVAPAARLPGGKTLPADFSGPGGCDLKPAAKPFAMVIKGAGKTQTYTVMCADAAPAPVRATLVQGLASLNTMRQSVATQPATGSFPEAERAHALGAIDRSINEIKASLSATE